MTRLLRWASIALGAIGAFIAIYVLYAHAASLATRAIYDGRPVLEHFASSESFSKSFTVRGSGLQHEVINGSLHVRGDSQGQGDLPQLAFVGPVRRLEEVRLRLRVKVPLDGPVDVSVGVETVESSPRSLRFVYSSGGDAPSYRLVGHQTSYGARVEAPSDLAHASPQAETDAPIRTLELRINTDNAQAMFSVDGVPLGSRFCNWPAGTDVRFIFGVAARERGRPVHAEITEAAYELLDHDTRELDFVDHLNGKFMDPRRWSVERARPETALSTFKLTPAGLHVTAKATLVNHPETIIVLRSQRMAFGSFHSSLLVHVNEMKRGAVLLSVSNLLPPPDHRRVGLGVLSDDDTGAKKGFMLGHWTGNSQLDFGMLAPRDEKDIHIELEYDATTRIAKGCVEGDCGLNVKLDLHPTELVTFSVVTELNGPEGTFDMLLREVAFDRKGNSWQ